MRHCNDRRFSNVMKVNQNGSQYPSQINSIFIVAIIVLITFLALSPSLKNDFTNWDDPVLLLNNPLILSLDSFHIWEQFKTMIPLTTLSFTIEHHFFKFNPFVYHFHNLILHLLVVSLVYLLALELGLSKIAAGLGALLFGIHPMHVESVAWVTERKDVLYSFFYMLSVYSYCRYEKGEGRKFYIFSLLTGLASILSKPMAFSLPFILFLCDWMMGKKRDKKHFLNKVLYFIYIIPITGIIYFSIERNPVQNLSESWLIGVWSLTFYIKKFFFPAFVSPVYALPLPVSIFNIEYASSLAIFIFVVMAVVFLKKQHLFKFACFYYFLSIFVLMRYDNYEELGSLSIVADRYMYLPSAGFCLWAGYILEKGMGRLEGKGILKIIGISSVVLIFLMLSLKTVLQCKVWGNGVTLWTEVIRHYPSLERAYVNRADAYLRKGELNLAMSDIEKALNLNPRYARGYGLRGAIFKMNRQYDKAMKDFDRAISLDPERIDTYLNRGRLFAQKNDFSPALDDFKKVLSMEKNNLGAMLDIAKVYLAKEDYSSATESYSRIIQFNPHHAQSYNNRGLAYFETGQYQLAIEDFTKALSLQPSYGFAFFNRAYAYYTTQQLDKSWQDIQMALKLGVAVPDDFLKSLQQGLRK